MWLRPTRWLLYCTRPGFFPTRRKVWLLTLASGMVYLLRLYHVRRAVYPHDGMHLSTGRLTYLSYAPDSDLGFPRFRLLCTRRLHQWRDNHKRWPILVAKEFKASFRPHYEARVREEATCTLHPPLVYLRIGE